MLTVTLIVNDKETKYGVHPSEFLSEVGDSGLGVSSFVAPVDPSFLPQSPSLVYTGLGSTLPHFLDVFRTSLHRPRSVPDRDHLTPDTWWRTRGSRENKGGEVLSTVHDVELWFCLSNP